MLDLTPDERADLVRCHTAALQIARKLEPILRTHVEPPATEPEPDPVPPRVDPDDPHRYVDRRFDSRCNVCGEPEHDARHQRPTPPPTPRPTRPPKPDRRTVAWDITLKAGTRLSGSLPAEDDVFEHHTGPFHLAVIWDQFAPEMEPTPTVILSNRYEGTGVIEWESGTVTVSDFVVDLGPNGAMPPRFAVIQSDLTVDDWVHLPSEELPGWVLWQAVTELDRAVDHHRGPYQFFRRAYTDDNDLAQFHGGADDWLAVCPTGRAYRWAEAIGALSRGIWLDWPDWTRRYWWDASAVGLAPQGWQWDRDKYPQFGGVALTDMSHGREWYGAVTALARDCKAARYMLMEAVWPEVRRSYCMDGQPWTTDPNNAVLYSPLDQILTMLPHPAWGNRREAHAINVVAYAAPYMEGWERELYVDAWAEFLDKQVDRFGRADFSFTGDAAHAGLPAPVAMFFQQALLQGAAQALVEYDIRAIDPAERIARWWGPRPPYYAHTGGSYRSATAAPHKGQGTPSWTHWTHPETVDPEAVLAEAERRIVQEGGGLHQTILDTLPPGLRAWEGERNG